MVFLGFPDAHLEPTMELRKALAREIRRHRPDVVIAESPVRSPMDDFYISHRTTWRRERRRWRRSSRRPGTGLTFPDLLDEGLEPHNVREVWIGGGEDGSDHFVDVADHMDTALARLKAHRSQLSEEIADKHFHQGREETAKKAGLNFAEGFKTIKLW